MVAEIATDLAILGRLILVLLLAGAIGWERERAHKAAGIGTHMLVGVSTTLFVTLGNLAVLQFMASSDTSRFSFNPGSIIEATVTGVSFLGAGMIIVRRGKEVVHGLTTAASVLATAAVGIAVGLERYLLAVGATMLVLLVLRTIPTLEKWVTSWPERTLPPDRE